MKRRIGIAVLICAALTLIGGSAFAAIPTQITYQGKLTDIIGQPVADGIYTMDFVIRRGPTGPESYWFEAARQVQVTNGLFTVNLGEETPIPASAFEGERWLDIRVNEVELSPRTKLTSSPYAFRAHTAEHVLSSAAVTELNKLTGSVTLAAGEHISIDKVGNTLTISGESIPNPLPVSQSGAWNVGITGEPTVSISSSENTVKTPTTSSLVKLFDTDQTVTYNAEVWSEVIDCTGFKEVRAAIRATNISNLSKVQVTVYFRTPNDNFNALGWFDFAPPSSPIAVGGNFVTMTPFCLFTIPVMSGDIRLSIMNLDAPGVTISSDSWIYLVN